MPVPKSEYASPAKAAWVLIFLTCGIAAIPFLGFISYLLAWLFLVPAFILSIVVMAKGGILEGITTLVFSVIIAPIFVVIAPFIASSLAMNSIEESSAKKKVY